MSGPLVVAGGSVAALAATDAAARAGRAVELLLPRRGVGGGFSPLVLDGRRLERGIRVLELGYEGVGEPPPLREYDAAGAGHRPFAREVDAYVRSVVGDDAVRELDRPAMWLRGRLGDELLLTSDLTDLPASLDVATARAIVAETAAGGAGILAAGRLADLRATGLSAASLENHGPTFHALVVDPFLRKIRAAGGDDVPADLRRKLWMALFHPRTLREAAAGEPVGFRPQRPFHDIVPGGPGAIVHALLARAEASPRVTVRRVDGIAAVRAARGGGVEITPVGEAAVVCHEPILALAPGELFAAAGVAYAPDRVHSVLAWCDVAEADVVRLPSFVHVVDPDVPAFRLSRGEVAGGRVTVCVELAHGVAKADAPAAAEDTLRRLGLVREGAPVASLAAFAGPTFTAPTFTSRERFAAARAQYDDLGLRAIAIGGAEAFGVDSLNEQLMQGRAAALRATDGAAALAAS